MKSQLAIAVFAVVVAASSSAAAQSDDEVRRAEEYYNAAVTAFRDGAPAKAAKLFRASYDLVPKPTLLYNEACAHADAGDRSAAQRVAIEALSQQLPPVVHAKTYARLQAWTGADSATVVATRPNPVVSALRADSAELDEDVAVAASAKPRTPRTSGGKIVGLSLLGLGGAALATAGVFELQVAATGRKLDDATDRGRYDELVRDGQQQQTIGRVALISAGALIVGGIVVWLVSR